MSHLLRCHQTSHMAKSSVNEAAVYPSPTGRGRSMMFVHQESSLSQHICYLALLRFGSLIFSQRSPQIPCFSMETFSTLWKEKKKKKPSLEGLVVGTLEAVQWHSPWVGRVCSFPGHQTPLPLGAQSSEIPFKAYIKTSKTLMVSKAMGRWGATLHQLLRGPQRHTKNSFPE